MEATRIWEQQIDELAKQTFSRQVRWESFRKNLSICTLLQRAKNSLDIPPLSLRTKKTRKTVLNHTKLLSTLDHMWLLQSCFWLTQVFDSICGWSTELSSTSVPSLECLVMTGSRICRAALWSNRERQPEDKQWIEDQQINSLLSKPLVLESLCVWVCVQHTLWAWRLLALFHQQASSLGVGGAIGWVIWAHNHPDEGRSTTWEITLKQSRQRDQITPSCWVAPSVTSLCAHFTWNWSCVAMSRTEGLGWKEGCEWYQPTTLKPSDDRTSQACVWDSGSISHCKPVLTLLHGSAAQICTQDRLTQLLTKLYVANKTSILIFLQWCFSLLFLPLILSLPHWTFHRAGRWLPPSTRGHADNHSTFNHFLEH